MQEQGSVRCHRIMPLTLYRDVIMRNVLNAEMAMMIKGHGTCMNGSYLLELRPGISFQFSRVCFRLIYHINLFQSLSYKVAQSELSIFQIL